MILAIFVHRPSSSMYLMVCRVGKARETDLMADSIK
jgi:hypothetical protein